jgi:hypothetical protein
MSLADLRPDGNEGPQELQLIRWFLREWPNGTDCVRMSCIVKKNRHLCMSENVDTRLVEER